MAERTGTKSRIVELLLDFKDRLTGKVPQVTSSARKLDSELDKAAAGITKSGKQAETGIAGFVSGIRKIKLAAAAAAGSLALLGIRIKNWAEASAIQLRAETKLETTLKRTTGASKEQIQALKDQASALQDVTGYGDETTISAQAMLGTFQLTAEQIALLTPRLLDMAENQRKLGKDSVDLEQIAIALGKAYTEGTSALKRYGVSLTDAQEEQLKQADGMERTRLLAEILDANFGGLAEAVGKTYEGEIRKADAASGDFDETLGDLITKNKDVARLIGQWTNLWKNFGKNVGDSATEIGAGVSAIAKALSTLLIGFRSAYNVITITFKGIAAGVSGLISAILYSFGSFSEFFDKDFAAKIFNAAEAVQNRVGEFVKSIEADFKDIDEAGRDLRVTLGTVQDQSEKTGDAIQKLGQGQEDPFANLSAGARELTDSISALTEKEKTLGDAIAATAEGPMRKGAEGARDIADAIGALIDKDAEAAESVREGLGKALQDLSAPELLQFQRDIAAAMTDIGTGAEATATVLDSTLGAALAKLGTDIGELATGISGEDSELIAAFDTIRENAQASADQITQAFELALGKLKSAAALKALKESLEETFKAGRIAADEFKTALDAVERKLKAAELAADPVEKAFKALGVESSRALKLAADEAKRNFDIIRSSGIASTQDIAAAWDVYATKAIESGDRTLTVMARQDAAALGLIKQYRQLTEEAGKTADENERSADAKERELETTKDLNAEKKKESEGGEKQIGPVTVDFEKIFEKYGFDVTRAFSTRSANPAAISAEATLKEAYREWLDENHPRSLPSDAANAAVAAVPSEQIIIRFESPDGRRATAFTDRAGADILREAYRQGQVAFAS